MSNERTFGVKLAANVDSYVAAMERARAATGSMSQQSVSNFEKVGASMQRVGGQMTRAVTLPIVGAGLAAVNMAGDFDKSFTRMVNLAGVSGNAVAGLKDRVLELAGETGQAPVKLADALYQASSAGLSTEEAMRAVEVAAKASAVGMGSAADIVGLVASATAAYGSDAITAAQATDVLTAAVRDGRADPAELAGSMGKLLPIAGALGISFPQVGGAVAYLSNVMGNTATTIDGFQGVLNKLYAPSAQAKDALKEMGTSATELKAAITSDGLAGALELLRTHGFDSNSDAAHRLFDDQMALSAATALLQDKSGSLQTTLDDVANSQGALSNAFDETSKTSSFKLTKAWGEIQAALVQGGEVVLPILSGVAGAAGDLADRFGDLPGPVQTVVVGLLGLAATGGPLLVMAGTVLKNFQLITSTLEKVSTKFEAMSGAAKGVTLGLGAAAGASAILLTAFAAQETQQDRVTDATQRYTDALAAVADGSQEALRQQIAKDIASDSYLDTLHKLGLKENEIADVISGRTVPAYDDARKSLDAMLDPTVSTDNAVRKLMDTYGIGVGQAQSFIDKTDVLTGAVSAARHGLEVADATLAAVGTTTDAAAESTANLGDRWWSAAGAAGDAETATADVGSSQRSAVMPVEDLSDALDRQVTSLENDLKAQMALVDFARGAADAQYALADSTDGYNRFLDELPGKLAAIGDSTDSNAEKSRQINELYREGAKDAAKMADDTVDAWNQAAGGTLTATVQGDKWRETMISAAATASGPARQAILDYVTAANGIPSDKATLIAALVDQGALDTAVDVLDRASTSRPAEIKADADQASLDTANSKLDALKDPRLAMITPRVDTAAAELAIAALAARLSALGATFKAPTPTMTSTGNGKIAGVRAAGGPVNLGSAYLVGEQGPELFVPGASGNIIPNRSAAGSTTGAGDFMRDLHANGMLSTTDYGAYLAQNSLSWQPPSAVGAASGSTAPSQGEQDSVMANRFAQGDLDATDYDAYLAHREASEVRFSDEQQRIWSIREQLKRDQVAATEAALKTADDARKQAEDDAQRRADDAIAQEDRRQAYLFDNQQITLAQYQDYLKGRRDSYGVYSAEWISLTSKMQDLNDAAAAAATKAAKESADAATESIQRVFEQMRLQQDLTDAIKQQGDTWDDLGQKMVAAYWINGDKNRTGEEKSQANADVEDARARAAAAVIAGADARANAAGLKDDTPEWSAFMRKEIEDFLPGHQEVAAQLQAYLAILPKFAAGGYIPARAGGTLGILAEAGQGEYALPEQKLQQLLNTAWAGSVQANWGMRAEAPSSPAVYRPTILATVQIGGEVIDERIEAKIDVYDLDTATQIQTGKR